MGGVLAGLAFAFKSYLTAITAAQRTRSALIGGLLIAQFGLGVMVVLAPGVPAILGAAHQIGAFCLLATSVASYTVLADMKAMLTECP